MNSTESSTVTPEKEQAFWAKLDNQNERIGELESWREVAQYQINQQAREAQLDRHRLSEQYTQLMSEIKSVGSRVHENELSHARQDGAKDLRRWLVPLIITSGFSVAGLCITAAAFIWQAFTS